MFLSHHFTSFIVIFLQLYDIKCNTEVKKDAPKGVIEVPLVKINNNYYGKITVGTPHGEGEDDQVFTVNFDTGSQHLWLVSTEKCLTPDCFGEDFTPYDRRKSKTHTKHEITEPFELGYADGTTVKGHLAWDYVFLGEGEGRIRIHQTIGLAHDITGLIENCDGIFGLGLLTESLFPGGSYPPMWTLFKEYNIEEFGIYLAKDTGKVIFGEHDERLAGPLTWHDVEMVDEKYEGWKIKFDKIKVGKGEGQEVKFETENMLALPDSGNNVIVGPEDLFRKLNAAIFKDVKFIYSAKYSFICEGNIDHLPTVTLVLAGSEYTLTPHDYIWVFKSGLTCRSGFVGIADIDHIVLGQIFMRAYYTKFNIIQQNVGFARVKK